MAESHPLSYPASLPFPQPLPNRSFALSATSPFQFSLFLSSTRTHPTSLVSSKAQALILANVRSSTHFRPNSITSKHNSFHTKEPSPSTQHNNRLMPLTPRAYVYVLVAPPYSTAYCRIRGIHPSTPYPGHTLLSQPNPPHRKPRSSSSKIPRPNPKAHLTYPVRHGVAQLETPNRQRPDPISQRY